MVRDPRVARETRLPGLFHVAPTARRRRATTSFIERRGSEYFLLAERDVKAIQNQRDGDRGAGEEVRAYQALSPWSLDKTQQVINEIGRESGQ